MNDEAARQGRPATSIATEDVSSRGSENELRERIEAALLEVEAACDVVTTLLRGALELLETAPRA
jgi:hypothetical protein